MTDHHAKGEWVEIRAVLLKSGERAPRVPEDTARVPLEMRCKGFLTAAAEIGQTIEIVTVTGRHVEGELVAVNPGYDHGFGPPVTALLTIGSELRALLDDVEFRS
jgi:hypothetical protein